MNVFKHGEVKKNRTNYNTFAQQNIINYCFKEELSSITIANIKHIYFTPP